MKFKLSIILLFFIQLHSCISIPNIKNKEINNSIDCHRIYRSLENDFLTTRGVQIATLQFAFWGAVFMGTNFGLILLLPIPMLEILSYNDLSGKKEEEWKKLECLNQ
ncbi:hypothetical protein EHQ16_09510 [Leptospira kanakyensis]|uniref:Uncharacterized protein n=1 Tax=Leptospira kanakyensis TaxID=2484968 RepID=A0A6N4PUH3_9LEPT|nr:hypothetical protein [Leptospira kanakyensis]TGK49460.1 hypothetical protein EHQ11_15680 [Leptospira kanakyensis]TGK60300.1 hypothetical protein EHQ16_09510 [Leptospira kanakyensis]TGK67699.1 hypothetical protein EHQ18_14310 [Leptospira kanakyensis]